MLKKNQIAIITAYIDLHKKDVKNILEICRRSIITAHLNDGTTIDILQTGF